MHRASSFVRLAMSAAILVAVAAPVASFAQPGSTGARAFVRWLYSHYPAPRDAHPFYPVGPIAPRVFDPSLLALIRADQKAANGEEPDYMDADVLCQCQDDEGLRWSIQTVATTGPSNATARVRLQFPYEHKTDMVTLQLTRTAQGWRIHDIVGEGGSWRGNLASVVGH
jgi:hypothetical protein